MTLSLRRPLVIRLVWAAGLTAVPAGATAQEPNACTSWEAVVVSAIGSVELRAGAGAPWQAARAGATLCRGYTVRVDDFGRATLRFRDATIVRLDRRSTLTMLEPEEPSGSLLEVLRGIIYVISRDPRALKVTTPYVNAGLEGTEFLIAVDARRTTISVLEGEVAMSNAAGEAAVPAGQRGIAEPGAAPRVEPLADAFAAAAWTPYYAPILYLDLPAADAEPESAQSADPGYYARRAAQRLRVGAAAEAAADIERALALAPRDAEALAVAALAALARGDRAKAAVAAAAAVEHEPSSVAAWIALSHVQQATLDFGAALASLERATTLDPENAIAWAGLAELRLANDDARGAVAAAERAAALTPDLAHVQTVRGFVYLETAAAERAAAAFRAAVDLDPESPLPRIGLALALLRQDELAAGREQAEIAVALDPLNSRIRSYMAKIYAEENRLELTESQLEIARALDPSDPTPHLYAALSRTRSEPIEAWRSLRTAAARNSERPVFRSSLRLDSDQAVRSFGLGQLYKDLGFEKLALRDAWKATIATPNDYSSHRLLAELYPALPRHETARVNELEQALLLQPVNVTPFPAQLAEANLFILGDMGPSDLGFSEYGPLVRRDGLALLASGITAANATDGVSVSVNALGDRVAYGGGHFTFSSDGFRENNDLEHRVTNARVDFRPSYATSFHAELRSSDLEQGDTRLLFDATAYNSLLRQEEHVDSLNLAMRRRGPGGGTLIASAILGDNSSDISGLGYVGERSGDRRSIDLQHLIDGARWALTSGLHYTVDERDEQIVFTLPGLPPATTMASRRTTHATLYAYSDVRLAPRLTATAGVSGDSLSRDSGTLDRVNPKLGLMFEPTARTTLRASYAETLEGPLLSKYNIEPRLEPTHVMGFNQFFFASEGEQTARAGLAVDHELGANLFTGLELSQRRAKHELVTVLPGVSTAVERFERDERLADAYLYWVPTSRMSVAVEYEYEDVDGNGKPLVDGYESLKTQRLPVALGIFGPRNIRAAVKFTFVDQEGNFSAFRSFPGPVLEPGADSFGVVDLSLSFRLPRRRGAVSAYLYNALDETFSFQDTDPEKQSIMPERMLAFRFTVAY